MGLNRIGAVKLTFTGGVSKRYELFFDLYPLEIPTISWTGSR